MSAGKESAALSKLTEEGRELYESAHDRNRSKLKETYGDKRDEILNYYDELRKSHEASAEFAGTVNNFAETSNSAG